MFIFCFNPKYFSFIALLRFAYLLKTLLLVNRRLPSVSSLVRRLRQLLCCSLVPRGSPSRGARTRPPQTQSTNILHQSQLLLQYAFPIPPSPVCFHHVTYFPLILLSSLHFHTFHSYCFKPICSSQHHSSFTPPPCHFSLSCCSNIPPCHSNPPTRIRQHPSQPRTNRHPRLSAYPQLPFVVPPKSVNLHQ